MAVIADDASLKKRLDSQVRRARWFHLAVPVLIAFTVTIAGFTLAGWLFGDAALQRQWVRVFLMKANTALGLLLLSIAAFGCWRAMPRWQAASRVCAAAAGLLGVALLAENLTGMDLSIDQLLARDYTVSQLPGRTSMGTALSFVMLGFGFWSNTQARSPRLSQLIFFLSSGVPIAALGGYLYRAPDLAPTLQVPVGASLTALCVLLLCMAGMCARTDIGLMKILVSESLAGVVARRLVPAAFMLPTVIGALLLRGERRGWFSQTLASAFLVSACALLFAAAVWLTTYLMRRTENVNAIADLRRRQAEKNLIEGEQRLRIAIDTAKLGTWEYVIGVERFVGSEQCNANYGLASNATLSLATLMSRIVAGDRERVEAAFAAAARGECDYREEYGVHWPDGSLHWVIASGRALRESDGELLRMVGVTLDVTDRVRAREELERADQRLRRAQEAGGVGVFSLELATNLLTATSGFCRIYGVADRENLPGEEIESLVVKEDWREIMGPRRALTEDEAMSVEYRIHRADDGQLRWIARRGEYERDASGKPLRLVGVVQDITERRMAQRAVEESAAQFRTFAQTLPNHVWTSPPSGARDWFNERAYEYTGARIGELNGRAWCKFVHQEDVEPAERRWRLALASGDVYEAELRLRRADGAFRWYLSRALPIPSADGTISRWVGTNTDIHQRKLAEAQSTRDRDRIWTLSQELMLVCDFAGVINAINPSGMRLLGFTEDEMVGRSLDEFIHPEDLVSTAAEVAKLANGVATLAFENRYRTKDGSYRVMAWTAVPDGNVIHGVARDITQERATAEDRSRIWSSTHDLMGTLDGNGFLRSVNPAWERLLGYTEAEVLSRPLADLVAEEDRPKLATVFGRLSPGEPLRQREDRLVHKDGSRSLMSWSAEPVGEMLYVVGRDITEQRAMEDALRQAQKMEAVGQLTGGIAHDFNNLLQGITGSLDLVQKRIAQGRVGELERFISNAMASAGRASALTHRLLAFSRRQPLNPRAVRANPLLASMDDLLRRTLGERVELELVMAGGLWMTQCDPNQLENAILNLAINARDAMPDGGRLTIETANAHIDGAYAARQRDVTAGQYVCLSVSDTGIGMSADTVAKAFEPFFTTKPIGQGTGLGLSMIYGFSRQSEGFAKIYSEVGTGTTVRLYLPRHRGAAEEQEPSPELSDAHVSTTHETVLVVEDDSVVRGLIVDVLDELAYRTLEAPDGPAGLAILQSKQRIDLLITDIGLPGLNGRQIAEAARQLRPDLKVLFMTGYAENAVLAAGFLEPGMSMITKPFAMEALATRIRETLEAR